MQRGINPTIWVFVLALLGGGGFALSGRSPAPQPSHEPSATKKDEKKEADKPAQPTEQRDPLSALEKFVGIDHPDKTPPER